MVRVSIKSTSAVVLEHFGDPLGAKMVQDASWEASGAMWMPVGAHLGTTMGQVGAKMTLCWPTWRQDVPKMVNPGLTWRAFGSILVTFFVSWARSCQNGRKQKKNESSSLLKVFPGSGTPLEGHVGPSWRYVGSSGRHLGATWRQDVPYERQDEPRERPRAPR